MNVCGHNRKSIITYSRPNKEYYEIFYKILKCDLCGKILQKTEKTWQEMYEDFEHELEIEERWGLPTIRRREYERWKKENGIE